MERTDERDAFRGGVDCVLEMNMKEMKPTREGRRECDEHRHSPFPLEKEEVVEMEWGNREKKEEKEKILH